MTDDQCFPLLVSHRSKLAKLAINDAHKRTLHGGPTATVAEMRRQIWVPQAIKKASACINKCVTCFRFNSGPTQQLMSDLPSSRIEVPERAFSCVGLDFAGPLTFKNGNECVKCYVAVFICFASKAVHLEAVSSLLPGMYNWFRCTAIWSASFYQFRTMTSTMQTLNVMHTMRSSSNDNETACCVLVANVEATVTH